MDIERPALRSAIPDGAAPADGAATIGGPADSHRYAALPAPRRTPGPYVDAVLLFVTPFTLLGWLGVALALVMLWQGQTSPEGMASFAALGLLVFVGAAAALGTGIVIACLHQRGSARAARGVGRLALAGLAVAAISCFLSLAL